MQTRHRTPTIFNLSMVDVLCCALGCVILLWLLNLREAKEKATVAGQANDQLKTAEIKLQDLGKHIEDLTRQRDEAASLADSVRKERDQVQRDLQEARGQLGGLDRRLTALLQQTAAVEGRLRQLTREQQELAEQKSTAQDRVQSLESLLREKDVQTKAASRRATSLSDLLVDAEARIKKLEEEVQGYRTRLTAAESRADRLQGDADATRKELAAARGSMTTLQQEKAALAEKANQPRPATDERFEGIALTGRRVVFLVDMSGSMELVDERTPDPQKWAGVRETLAKLMRSLPNLERYQVVLFSDRITYLFGNDGLWLVYDPKTTVEQVLQAMAAVKPKGATNMYEALQAAFRFRALGMDTIYVLSDGLPNVGPGLTQEQMIGLTKEVDRSEVLARYIRNLLRRDWNRDMPDRPRVHINTIGFFYESPDVGAFLWALARENEGSFVGMSKP